MNEIPLKLIKQSLTDQTKYRLNDITKNEYHFNSEINQRKSCSKKLSKYVAKSKLNSIETLVSQTLIDSEISHEEFVTILKERGKCEKIKENFKNVSENMRLNSANSKRITTL